VFLFSSFCWSFEPDDFFHSARHGDAIIVKTKGL
jgi:hypothetical protein